MIEKKIDISQLEIGMYVSRLDRPWVDTPFLFQGFLVKGTKEIERTKKYCKHVYIDVERGKGARYYLEDDGVDIKDLDPREVKVEKILHIAKKKHKKITSEIVRVMDQIKEGKHPNISVLVHEVMDMVESMLVSTDAFLLMSKLKTKDDYTYTHLISASILATAFGKDLGLKVEELQELAVGCMLFDIGKIKLPQEIILKTTPLTEEEKKLVKDHVNYSVEFLRNMKGISKTIIDIAINHHERFNGSGYPDGKHGRAIPLYAQIAGIVDCYDAMTSERRYKGALSHDEAVRDLYARADIDFHKDFIEQFVQCLGVYPSGAIVELSTGEVGIVLQQNRIRRLRPRIMIILNRKKESNNYFPVIDLMTELEDKEGKPLSIAKTLDPKAYGISPEEYYL